MRICKYVIFSILALAIVATSANAVEDAILAVVNSEIITVRDLQDYTKSIFSQLQLEGKSSEEVQEIMAQYEAKGIQQLIDDRLILSAADDKGLEIRQEMIDKRIDEIKSKYTSTDDFLRAIEKNGLTVNDIRKKIEGQLKGQVMVETEVNSKIYVKPQEVTEFFNKNKDKFSSESRIYLDTIFVKSRFGREGAVTKIQEAKAQLDQGEDFMDVAKKYSELPSVGELMEKDLLPEFKETIDEMKLGQISNIIEVKEGFYIIRLSGRVSGSVPSLTDVKDVIYQRLFQEKFQERFREWIESLRKKAYVEIKF